MASPTLSGEQLHKTWASYIRNGGKLVTPWHELPGTTQGAWNALATALLNAVAGLTSNTPNTQVMDDRLSWMLGQMSHTERSRMYGLLYNLGHRVNR